MVGILRRSQRKRGETDRLGLGLRRHSLTLPQASVLLFLPLDITGTAAGPGCPVSTYLALSSSGEVTKLMKSFPISDVQDPSRPSIDIAAPKTTSGISPLVFRS